MAPKTRAVTLCMLALGAVLAPAVPASAGGFCAGYAGEKPTAARGSRVTMRDNCFTPTVLYVEPGAEVTFANTDPEPHTVGGAAGSFGDMHRELAPGAEVAYTFGREGVYPYVCLIHPGMAGAIVVGDGLGKASASQAGDPVGTRPAAASSRGEESRAGGPSGGSITLAAALATVALATALWFGPVRARLSAREEKA